MAQEKALLFKNLHGQVLNLKRIRSYTDHFLSILLLSLVNSVLEFYTKPSKSGGWMKDFKTIIRADL